eukprot:gene19031-biopygen20497
MTTRHPGTTQRKWQPQPFVRQPNTTAANNPMHLPASLKDVFLNRMILAAQVAWIPTGQSVTPYYTSVRSTLPWKPGRRPQIVAQKLRFVAFADSALSIDTRVTPLPPQPPSLWDPPHAATIRGSRKVCLIISALGTLEFAGDGLEGPKRQAGVPWPVEMTRVFRRRVVTPRARMGRRLQIPRPACNRPCSCNPRSDAEEKRNRTRPGRVPYDFFEKNKIDPGRVLSGAPGASKAFFCNQALLGQERLQQEPPPPPPGEPLLLPGASPVCCHRTQLCAAAWGGGL